MLQLREAERYFEIDDVLSAAEAKIANCVFQENRDKKKYRYASAFFTELFKRLEDKEHLGLAMNICSSERVLQAFVHH